jgi:hypothetical protein
MCSKRDIIIFFAGVSAFHTISHIMIGYLGILPLTFLGIDWTVQLNIISIAVNAIITLLLLWWAKNLKK